jgi:hypothetical protein
LRSGRLCCRQIPEIKIMVTLPENDFRTEVVAEPQGVEGNCNADGGFFHLISKFVAPHGHGHVAIYSGKRVGR